MPRLSRRKVVAALSSAPLLAQGDFAKVAVADPVLVLCAHYGDLLRRRDALMRTWGDHEAWLAANRSWFTLSNAAEQRALPEGQMLDALDEEFNCCVGEGARVMRRLRSVPARTITGAAAKLSVVAEFIEPDDYPAAHRVLLSAIADLWAMNKD
jgi:hypothetical protein